MNPEKFEQLNKEDEKFNELKDKFETWLRKDLMKNNEKTAEFVERIRKEYPDNHDDFKFYHILSYSGLSHECTEPDFPGDYSVEKFIEDQYNSLK